MKLWGRVNSVNVQKVLWCLEELQLPYDRTDAGMQFGVVGTAEYRALNPNGRVPTLEDGGLVLWESNSILRYLCQAYPAASGGLYPDKPGARARVDRWLDWQLSTLTPAERPLFWGMVRTAPDKRDPASIALASTESAACWRIVDAQLAALGGGFIEGDGFTLADLVLGAFARRWYGVEIANRPDFPALEEWYGRVATRAGFVRFCAPPLT